MFKITRDYWGLLKSSRKYLVTWVGQLGYEVGQPGNEYGGPLLRQDCLGMRSDSLGMRLDSLGIWQDNLEHLGNNGKLALE